MEPAVAQGRHVMGPAVRIAVAVLAIADCRGEHEGSGMITPARVPAQELTARGAAQTAAREQLGSPAPAPKQILFGDLTCIPRSPPTRSSAALPMLQGECAHPPADACDFARFCSALDFWSKSVLQIEYSYYDISATSFGCKYGDCRQALSFWTND